MLHQLLQIWFHWVEQWGYVGVFLLMALESSIFPVPSEIVMPPAAFWASQGRMDFWGVVLAGTAGSYFGSIVSYFVAQWLGLPVLTRWGRFVRITPEKLKSAETWVLNYGVGGIFLARLLPVVRHLISIPAGILRMKIFSFSAATTLGAFLWCTVLSWFGREVIGSNPELLQSPEAMSHVIKAKLWWFVTAVLIFAVAYVAMTVLKNRQAPLKKTRTN